MHTCMCVPLCCRSPYGIIPGGAPPAEPIGGGMAGSTSSTSSTGFGENHILLFTVFNPLYPITVVRDPTLLNMPPLGLTKRMQPVLL